MSKYVDCDKCYHGRVCVYRRDFVKLTACDGYIPTADVVEIPKGGIGNLSDGYHTFNELYHHRAILFSVICNSMPDKAWKSKLHDTGDMFDGMFIVGIETPEGQATYHYDIEPYWDMFKVKELEKAPKWDGHTPQIAIDRIAKLSADVAKLTEENVRLRLKVGAYQVKEGLLTGELDAKCDRCIARERAGTVRKMQERLKEHSRKMQSSDFGGEFWCKAVMVETIDQIAEEIIDDGKQ